MISLSPELILAMNPRHPRPDVAAPKLQAACARWGVTTPRQVAMFLGQLTHESGLIPQEENLSYRATRIHQVWPSRFPTVQSAEPYAFNPPALAERVYGNRGGNTRPGMAWRYHGRGPIQLTFHDNYLLHGQRIGIDLIAQPDALLQYGAGFLAAGSYWHLAGLNAAAERGDVTAVTRAINGGLIGLDDRERLYQRALNRVPRVGLLATDPPVDVDADTQADLDMRHEQYARALALLRA